MLDLQYADADPNDVPFWLTFHGRDAFISIPVIQPYPDDTPVVKQCGARPKARDFTNQRTRRAGEVDEVARGKNRDKSKIRARVEHVFAVVKRLWGTKVRYRGLAKNANRAFVALALTHVYLSRRRWMAQVPP
jgi:hypothetical protein